MESFDDLVQLCLPARKSLDAYARERLRINPKTLYRLRLGIRQGAGEGWRPSTVSHLASVMRALGRTKAARVKRITSALRVTFGVEPREA